MSMNGRVSRNSPGVSPRSGVSGVAGAAGTFPITFKLDEQCRSYIAMRCGGAVGGIVFNSGGWFAFERTAEGKTKWSRTGRMRAHFAATDMWGEEAGVSVARLPEARTRNVNDPLVVRERSTDGLSSAQAGHVSTN